MPASLWSQNSLANAGSVALCWVTAYCFGLRAAIADGSLRYWSLIVHPSWADRSPPLPLVNTRARPDISLFGAARSAAVGVPFDAEIGQRLAFDRDVTQGDVDGVEDVGV